MNDACSEEAKVKEKDPFLLAIEVLKKAPRLPKPGWSTERRYVEDYLDALNDLRISRPGVTFEQFCNTVEENGGPRLDPIKLQNALYRVNRERSPETLKRLSNEKGKRTRRRNVG